MKTFKSFQDLAAERKEILRQVEQEKINATLDKLLKHGPRELPDERVNELSKLNEVENGNIAPKTSKS